MRKKFHPDQLSCDAMEYQARCLDWSSLGLGSEFEYYEAQRCDGEETINNGRCKAIVLNNGQCELCGYQTCGADGPMMNYFYPIGDTDSGFKGAEAAELIVDFPLCVVELLNEDVWGLALTGGGMDLTWEICGAFVALGYVPPTDKWDLPRLAGMELTAKSTRIIRAIERGLGVQEMWLQRRKDGVARVRKRMRENKRERIQRQLQERLERDRQVRDVQLPLARGERDE